MQQNLKIIDKGGRPPKNFIKQHIIEIVSKLKRAYPKQVYLEHLKEMKDDSQKVGYDTILRYMERMAEDEGILKRQAISSLKNNTVYLYELKMESE